jgi:hypothetical protein
MVVRLADDFGYRPRLILDWERIQRRPICSVEIATCPVTCSVCHQPVEGECVTYHPMCDKIRRI